MGVGVGEEKVISGDDFSAAQPVPTMGREMSTSQKEENIKPGVGA